MKKFEAWLSQASRNLEFAKKILDDYQEHAYYNAMISGELALKSLLVWGDAFDEKKHCIHNMKKLIDGIEDMNKLPMEVLDKIRLIVLPKAYPSDNSLSLKESDDQEDQPSNYLSYQDISYADSPAPNGNVNIHCESEQIPRMRYPSGSVPPSKYINKSDAQEKIILAEKLLIIVKEFIASD